MKRLIMLAALVASPVQAQEEERHYHDTVRVTVRQAFPGYVVGHTAERGRWHPNIRGVEVPVFLDGHIKGDSIFLHEDAQHDCVVMGGEVSGEEHRWVATRRICEEPRNASHLHYWYWREGESWLITFEEPEPSDTWRGLRIAAEGLRAGYVRPSWNVADTTIWREDGSPTCTAYTRTAIDSVGVGDGLDREHIVALAEAWDSRPNDDVPLLEIAEDPSNLTLSAQKANREKGDSDAAEWEPTFNGAWYASRVLEVKLRYDLSVDPAELAVLERLLSSGTDEITCEDGS